MEKYLIDQWPGKSTLEEVITWGVCPLIVMNEINDRLNEEANGTDQEEDEFFYYDRKSKLKNLKEVLYRYDFYQMLLARKVRELCPDDPLVTDAAGTVKAEIERREKRSAEREAKQKALETAQKRLFDVMDQYDIGKQAIHDILDAINGEAKRMEKTEDQKKKLIQKISAFTDEEAEQLFDVVLAIHNRKKAGAEPPEAEKETTADKMNSKKTETWREILSGMVKGLPDEQVEEACNFFLALQTEPPQAENEEINAGMV